MSCCGGGCCGSNDEATPATVDAGAGAMREQAQQQQAQSTATEPAPRRELKPPAATSVHLEPGATVANATPAAQSGPEHVTEPTRYDAVLLSGFGGPEGQDDVIPFLRNVTRGRGIPEERLEEVATHYRHFGGVSPINEHNRELKAALEAELERRGIDLPVIWGNRNWQPYMADAVREADERGFRKLIAVATSAYSSYSSCRQYRENLADASAKGADELVLEIDKIGPYALRPAFVAPNARLVVEALRSLADVPDAELALLFVTHSIEEALLVGNRIALLSPHPGRMRAEVNSGGDVQATAERIHRMLFEEEGATA